ncbi:hypothetical protein ABPG77_003308 [Micractinium sp. CCAP 211/92]
MSAAFVKMSHEQLLYAYTFNSPSGVMMTSQEPQSVNLQLFSADERLQQAVYEITLVKQAAQEAQSPSQVAFLEKYAAQCMAQIAAALRDGPSLKDSCLLESIDIDDLVRTTSAQLERLE